MKNNLYKRRVKDVMSRSVVSVHPQDSMREAIQLMVENRVSALPVTDRRSRCVGILSTSDLVDLTRELDDELLDLARVSDGSRLWLTEKLSHGVGDQKVQELMTHSVASVNSETPIVEASREMLRQRVHRLPVTDDQYHLLGIISTMDILSAVSDSAPA